MGQEKIQYAVNKHENIPFSGESVWSVSTSEPLQRDQLFFLHALLREQYEGVFRFEQGSLFSGVRGRVMNKTCSLGWHIHTDADAVNISNGSDIETIFTTPEAACAAIHSSLDEHEDQLVTLSRGHDLSFSVLEDAIERHLQNTVEGFIAHAREKLVYKKPSLFRETRNVDLAYGMNIFRSLCSVLIENRDSGYSEKLVSAAKKTLKRSQEIVPKDLLYGITPLSCSGYVIPSKSVHARSALQGPLYRPSGEVNMAELPDGFDMRERAELAKKLQIFEEVATVETRAAL